MPELAEDPWLLKIVSRPYSISGPVTYPLKSSSYLISLCHLLIATVLFLAVTALLLFFGADGHP